MSDSKDGKRDESRKRKFGINELSETVNHLDNDDQQTSDTTAEVEPANTVEPQSSVKSVTKQKREFDKFISTFFAETNGQVDLQTQQVLVVQQALSEDDSDDEPLQRRARCSDYPPLVTASAQHADNSNNNSTYSDTDQQNTNASPPLQNTTRPTVISSSADMSCYYPVPSTSSSAFSDLDSINTPNFDEPQGVEYSGNDDAFAVPAPLTFPPPPHNSERSVPNAVNPSESSVILYNGSDSQRNGSYNPVGIHQEERAGVSDEMMNIFTDDDYHRTPQSGDRLPIPAHYVDSDDDDEYLQMVENVNNISVSTLRGNSRASRSNAPNQVVSVAGPSGLPRSVNWRNPRGRHGRSGRGPHPQQQSGFTVAYRLINEDPFALSSHSYYVVGNDHIFYPIDVGEQPTRRYCDLMPEALNRPLQPQFSTVEWNQNFRNESFARFSLRVPLSAARRVTGGRSGVRSLRSLSSEQVPNRPTPPVRAAEEPQPSTSQQHAVRNVTPRATPILNVIGICPICTKGLSTLEVASTFCGHLFCLKCIKKAMIINGKRCPTCRQPLAGPCYHLIYF